MTVSYHYTDPDPARQRALDAMRARLDASVGLGPNGSGEGLEHGAALLYPRDPIDVAMALFKKQFTCALRVLREYEDAGLDDKRLRRPYSGRNDAMVLVHGVLRAYGAWVDLPVRVPGAGRGDPRLDAPWPRPGYVVIIGERAKQQAHALSVVDETPDGLTVSVDGGQPDRDGPDPDTLPDGCIQRVGRRFVRHAPGDLRAYTPAGVPGRLVYGLGDLAGLVAKLEARGALVAP
jgi:hypothetical protein